MSSQPPPESSSPYQERILAHARGPIGYKEHLEGAVAETASNPVCGDEITVLRRWSSVGTLELGFHCRACMLCKASASIMIGALGGLDQAQATALVTRFKAAYERGVTPLPTDFSPDLTAIFDLQRYPTRSRCVLLPWDAVAKLLYN